MNYNYRLGALNSVIASALDSLDTCANTEYAREYMDGCPENMSAADVAELLEWLDENDLSAASVVRSALSIKTIAAAW